ncbi:MAG: glutamate--tRNA ligase [Sedimentisphaerales bacterium]|nr:glutamate--tRNA ligase [Sedimentisphaerales bacterium]
MSEQVVTRFAPSPTGYLHVGGARTAIFDWLWAKHNGGKFILRIEDTDQKRNTPTAMQQLLDDLRWLGIDWDEGPQVGGPNGPYLQSQRRDISDKFVKKLLDEQKAYYCFDTSEQLQTMREHAEAQKKGFAYSRPENFPDTEDVEKARRQGRPVTVRFAMPQDKSIVVDDVVRGRVEFAAGEIGDFIIQKSDGFPTYNFACVIDDELMGVTHVIRGQEHLMNTPAQQALQDALGFRRPIYAHMSVTISQGGGKLSKRERPKTLQKIIKVALATPNGAGQNIDLEKLAGTGNISRKELDDFLSGQSVPDMPSIDAMAKYLGTALPEINIVDFLRSGYLPETMVNFLALLGWNPGGSQEVMSIGELISSFDLSRLTKSNSLFDRDKLLAFNTEHIKMLETNVLVRRFRDYIKAVDSPLAKADDKTLEKIIKANEGARTLAQMEQKSRFLFLADDRIVYDDKAVKKILMKHDGMSILQVVRHRLSEMDELSEQKIEDMLRSLAEEKQVKFDKVAQPLRVALCGTAVSLPIFNSVQMLGKKSTLARIDITLKKFAAVTEAERR